MGPLASILPSGQSERQSKETEIWEQIYLFPVLPHSVRVDVEASVLSVYTLSHPQVSHLKLLASEVWNMVFSTGSRTTGAFLGVGIGVQSMISTSFPFKAIGKQGLEHGVSTGSRTTGATGAFLGVCNSAVWMDCVNIGVVDGSGGAVSVSVSFVTKKEIWN